MPRQLLAYMRAIAKCLCALTLTNMALAQAVSSPDAKQQFGAQRNPGAVTKPAMDPLGSEYRIGAGDSLRVSVFDHPELSVDLRVSQSGNLTFPLIGQMQVSGMSPHEVESALARSLSIGGFVKEPQITVLVTDFQSQKVSVMGQVAKPGQYSLSASQKVMDLLAAAGGPVNMVAADDALVIRKDGSKVALDLIALM